MPITKLIVGGFKSLKNPVEIPFAPITLVFGPNSAGKSVIKDALMEFRRRLTRVNLTSGLSTALSRFVAHGDLAHQLPRPDEGEEATFTRVLLGCEIDPFEFLGALELEDATRWNELGRELFRSLEGRTVGYQMVGEAGDWTLGHEVSVDGSSLFEFTARNGLASLGAHPADWPTLEGLLGEHDKTLGLLSIHIDHPLWSDGEFRSLVNELRDAVACSPGTWARSAVWGDEKTLDVRLSAWPRRLGDWKELTSDTSGISSLLPDDVARVNEPLSAICAVINELVHQMESSVSEQIEIAHVSGSRQLLSEDDVRSEWTPLGRFGSGEVTGFRIRDYAHWLGLIAAESDEIEVGHATRSKDDFVNDTLSRSLFSARGYRVKAEVSVRTETMVVPRDATWSTEPEVSMQSTLFLQDEQGRTLGFNQVGSGISYVLPVLTALWGAERSLIEQPELHLHPAAQCEMGDAVIRAFNRGRFSIVETHSEHLLLRILRRIRQTSQQKVEDPELRCPPEAVAVLYFAPMLDGTTQVHRLRVTRGGDFMDRWPDGFFEERSRELFDE